jgi:outer membrane protein
MNKVLQAGLFAVIIIAIGFLLYKEYNRERIVYIDSAQLVNGYLGMKEARTSYQQKTVAWKSNIDTLMQEVQRSIQKHEKEMSGMTKKERELSEELIKTKQKQLRDYQRAIQEKAQQEDTEMTTLVLEEVNTFLKEYGERNNYRMIMAATEYGNLAYADEDLDITKEVLEQLNKRYRGE